MTQWCRGLCKLGWSIRVFCRHYGYNATPELLQKEVGDYIALDYLGPQRPHLRAEDAKPPGFRIKQLIKQLVLPLAIPDAQIGQWHLLTGQAKQLARQWQPQVVLSSSPPHSIHTLAQAISQELQIPWVVDFRDPYLIDERFKPSGLAKLFHFRHERYDANIYRSAALITHAIPIHYRWSRRKHQHAKDKIKFLPNGFPAEILTTPAIQPDPDRPNRRLSIRVVGVVGKTAVEVMPTVIRGLLERGVDCEFRQTGKVNALIEQRHLLPDDRITYRGRVPHREALAEMASADLLLKFDDVTRSEALLLSAKLFEYLALGRPILVVNPSRPDRLFLRGKPWCKTLNHPTPTELIDQIQALLQHRPQPSPAWLQSYREKFNREGQVQELSNWLERVIDHRPLGDAEERSEATNGS